MHVQKNNKANIYARITLTPILLAREYRTYKTIKLGALITFQLISMPKTLL
jgi:hypothetical protein